MEVIDLSVLYVYLQAATAHNGVYRACILYK